jgi:SAM-dependent methyltransferase
MNTSACITLPLANGQPVQPSAWEEAYLRFESSPEEIRKFQRRLIRLGAGHWWKNSEVVELFCGRGNGLRALHWLGFERIEGIDLSPCLASRYNGPGKVFVGDCRDLPLPAESRDILIVQGGLPHLPRLPEDLDRALSEAARVLRPGGRFVAVEPWLTPFLRFVHLVSKRRLIRRVSAKIDALATMIENEKVTYEQWLNNSAAVLQSLREHFSPEIQTVGWGKLNFVGRKQG